jgi:outer membrane protein OmpA-like peptidoglycan-associated protein
MVFREPLERIRFIISKALKNRMPRYSFLKAGDRFSKAVFVCFILLTVPGSFLTAQTAAEMDVILSTPAVNFAQASRFVLTLADAADETSAAAYDIARESGWLPKRASGDRPIKLGELCFLIMNAFHIKGSFLYAMFPGPRYAFRELDYLRLIPGRRDPAMKVSGERLLQILGMVQSYRGDIVEYSEEAAVAAEPPPEAEDAQAGAQELMEEREQIAEVIRTELEEHEVMDTSVRVVEEGIVISMDNIRFRPDSVELIEDEKSKLWEIAAILLQYPSRKILVGGHTAMAGDEAGRIRISTERARAVADFLLTLRVRRAEDITVRGFGAEQPLGDNATEEGQALNRRVEIILLDEERE